MPFLRCIAAAEAGQLIGQDRAQQMREAYDAYESEARTRMPPPEAAAEAGSRVFAEFEGEVADRRRQTFLALAKQKDISARLDSYRSYVTGKPNPYLGATGIFDRLLPGRKGPALEQTREYWRAQLHAQMDKAFAVYKRDLLGRQGVPANEGNIVAEAFGRDTGDAEARAIAQGWIKTRELARAMFNRFGGHIGELEDYGFPQYHSQRLVNAVPFEEWRDFLKSIPGGITAMGRYAKAPLQGEALDKALRHMYENIVTAGWATREATQNGGRGALANQRAEGRFLFFNTPEGWLAYQKRFGDGNVFDTMLHHIEGLSRDIAAMQELGPNPSAMVRWICSDLDRRAAVSRAPEQMRQKKVAVRHVQDLYAHYTGEAMIPVHQWLAEIEGDIRNITSSALLGMATLTAVPTDMNFSRMTRAMNGMPQVRALGSYVKQLNPLSAEDRMMAVRNGLGAEAYARTLTDSARSMDQIYGHAWSKWTIDRTLTWNGLSPHTDGKRRMHGIEAQGLLAASADKTWNDLDPVLKSALERYRIGEAEWNDIRTTPLHEDRGATFLRQGDIMNRTDLPADRALDLAQRVADWIMTETEFAVPSSSLAAHAYSRGQVRPGTIAGTVLSSPLMFKTFALTYLMSHGRRMLAQANWRKRSAYLGSILVTSTIAGAAALQMREIANCRQPRDMTSWKFWAAAFATGGGLGMLGDLLYAGVNSAGRDIAQTIAGPIAGLLADVIGLAVGAPIDAAQAKDPAKGKSKLANNAITFAKRYTPFTSIWYVRAALERGMFDAMQSEIDPNWKRRVHNVERWYRKNFNQGYWWHRGEMLPDEAPDPNAAVGER